MQIKYIIIVLTFLFLLKITYYGINFIINKFMMN